MHTRLNFNHFTATLILGLISCFVYSQTPDDAWKSYSIAKTTQKNDSLQKAISEYHACLEICEKLAVKEKSGEIDKLAGYVKEILPSLYLQLAEKNVEEQLLNEGLRNTINAKELATSVYDTSTLRKAKKFIPKIYYLLGVSKMNENDFAGAIANMDEAIKHDPDYLDAYYMKAFTYRKQGDDELFKIACKKAILESDRLNNNQVHNKITDMGFQYFQRKGLSKKNEAKYENAEQLLNNALEFNNTDVTTLYLLAMTYNALGKYDEAIKTGESALVNETGGEEAKAKIYLVIGESYEKLGKKDMACKTLKKAAIGQYTDYANHYMKYTLKCQE